MSNDRFWKCDKHNVVGTTGSICPDCWKEENKKGFWKEIKNAICEKTKAEDR